MTPTEIRRKYGFQNMAARASMVDEALSEIQHICEAISDLAAIEDQALMDVLGITPAEGDSGSSSEDDYSEANESRHSLHDPLIKCIFKSIEDIPKMLLDFNHNWFEFMDHVLSKDEDISSVSKYLYDTITKVLDEEQLHLVRQSYYAFCTDEEYTYKQNHTARAINGEIISKSEFDDLEAYIGVLDEGKVMVMKKRKQFEEELKENKKNFLAESHFLSRRVSKQVRKFLHDCQSIGEVEKFVQQHSVGGDAWRRIGVLTFDGNIHLKTKVTYEKIRQHLQNVFQS